MNEQVIILGAGSKAVHLVDLFNMWYEVHQFYDTPHGDREQKRGKPVQLNIDYSRKKLVALSAVGDTRPKRDIIRQFKNQCNIYEIPYRWGKRVHKSAIITNTKEIGVDFTLRELSSIGSQCKIGNHVAIGPLVNISHNSIIGDYSTICGQVAISGGVKIGEGVFIGQGASIKPNIVIGDGVIVGTGSVVVKDIPEDMVVAGNPASRNPKFKDVTPWNIRES